MYKYTELDRTSFGALEFWDTRNNIKLTNSHPLKLQLIETSPIDQPSSHYLEAFMVEGFRMDLLIPKEVYDSLSETKIDEVSE